MGFKLKPLGLFILILLCLMNQTGCIDSPCENSELRRQSSPDGKLEAVSFKRSCGATTKDSFQLSIIKYGEKLGNSKGNTFISYDKFDVSWKNNKELILKSDSSDIFKEAKTVKGVTISYSIPID